MSARNDEILKQAKELHKKLNCKIPLVILLAMIKQEAPRQHGALSNTGDGLLQVTHESGHREGQYGNTKEGIKNNLTDGITTLNDCATNAGGNVAKAVSQYNGGPSEKKGDKDYTKHVAKRIREGEVAANFGEEFSPEKLSDADKKALSDLESYKRP